jgi:hypothetical protein
VGGNAIISNFIQLGNISTLEKEESCGAYIVVVEKKIAVTPNYKVSGILELLKHTVIESRYSRV